MASYTYSVLCEDVLMWSATISRDGSQVATIRSRRLHTGDVITTGDAKYVFERSSMGARGRGARNGALYEQGNGQGAPKALVRLHSGTSAGVSVRIGSRMYIASPSGRGYVSIERVRSSNDSSSFPAVPQHTRNISRRVGVLRPVPAPSKWKQAYQFTFSEQVPDLLPALLLTLVKSASEPGPDASAPLLKSPTVALTAAVGAAVC